MTANKAETADIPYPGRVSQPALRERRRQQTEREICDAALDLFERRGVDQTTVDDIAAAAGVSARTFFRYFATKEAAALVSHVDLDDRVEQMLDDLAPGRPLLAQLEDMWGEILTALDDGRSDAGRLVLRVRRLMLAEPALRQAAVSIDAQRLDAFVARATAALDLDDDLGTRVTVQAAGVAVRVAMDRWAEARDSGDRIDLLATYAAACRHLHTMTAPGHP
ncbi:TetR family transcriptional regulator [Nocardioides hwasunensis]